MRARVVACVLGLSAILLTPAGASALRDVAPPPAGVTIGGDLTKAVGLGSGPAAPSPLEFELRAAQRKSLKRLNVKASCSDDACEARIGGKVVVRKGGAKSPYRLRVRTPSLDSGAIHKLGLRLKRPRKAGEVMDLLAEGARAKATIRGTATAADGRTASARVRVTLTG